MPASAPPPRIGKTTGTRPRPADSEKLPPNARWHVASELASADPTRIPPPPKRRPAKSGK